jgi:hypothetical protein
MAVPARYSPKPAFRNASTNSGTLKISNIVVARISQTAE